VNAMKSHRSIPSIRTATIGAVSAALLAGGVLGAAAPITAHPAKKPMPTSKMSEKPMPGRVMGSITIKATPTTIRSGGTVVFTGRTKGLRIGTKLILQERLRGRWIPLSATSIKAGNSYILKSALNAKGRQQLRVVQMNTTSPWTTVIVH